MARPASARYPRSPKGRAISRKPHIVRTPAFALVLIGLAAGALAQDPPTPDWNTPKRFKNIADHPRLYVTQAQIDRMVNGRGEAYAENYELVEKAALTGLNDTADPLQGVGIVPRQFRIAGRIQAFAIQYKRTGDRKYIDASIETIKSMESWFAPNSLWQLWHGGYCAAIALSYDMLYHDLTPAERKFYVDFAREHCIRPFLQRTARGRNMKEHGEHGSWWQNIISNWNPVCNGGAGLLALAMYDELDEAQTVIDRVNASLDPIIEYLQETRGGWVEGLGYWNWTIHYMALFYISYERVSGEQHEGFRSPGFRQTLTFVDYFVPYDEALGFGDNQHGGISYSLLRAAEHLGDDDVLRRLQYFKQRLREAGERKQAIRDKRKGVSDTDTSSGKADADEPVNIGYGTTHALLIDPESIIEGKPAPTKEHLLHTYPKQGWGAIADQWPMPNVYAAFRSGELGGAHTQDDLLTWHGVIGTEVMVKNIYSGHVGQNAYGSRRNDLYEISARSKNSLLVGGLGPKGRRGNPASAKTTEFKLPTGPMVLLEATGAMDTTRNRPRYVARAFLVIRDKGLLVLDRVIAPGGGGQPVEVRTFTPRDATFGESDVLLEGEFETARMTFASNVPSTLSEHKALMTFPRPNPPTMMRWQTNDKSKSTVMASLLSRGGDPVDLAVEVEQVKSPDDETKMIDGPVIVKIKGNGWSETIKLTDRLLPIE